MNTRTFHRDAYRVGDRVVIKTANFLTGLPASVIAVSDRTGGLTLELLEGRNAWHAGDRLNVAPYEVQRGSPVLP